MIKYLIFAQFLFFCLELYGVWHFRKKEKPHIYVFLFIYVWVGVIVTSFSIKLYQFLLEETINIDTGTFVLIATGALFYIILAPIISLNFIIKKRVY